jgi:predicted ArsR family transcriptional regulator
MQMLETLDSDTSKLVVLYLQRVGDATPDRIAERLRLPLMTVLATVRYLDEEGLVRRLAGSERIVLADGRRGLSRPGPTGSDRERRIRPGRESVE